jgi:hypothetical protein
VDVDVGVELVEPGDALRGRDEAQVLDALYAGRLRILQAATAEPPVASIGSRSRQTSTWPAGGSLLKYSIGSRVSSSR